MTQQHEKIIGVDIEWTDKEHAFLMTPHHEKPLTGANRAMILCCLVPAIRHIINCHQHLLTLAFGCVFCVDNEQKE
jgi:hypothetical protein